MKIRDVFIKALTIMKEGTPAGITGTSRILKIEEWEVLRALLSNALRMIDISKETKLVKCGDCDSTLLHFHWKDPPIGAGGTIYLTCDCGWKKVFMDNYA